MGIKNLQRHLQGFKVDTTGATQMFRAKQKYGLKLLCF